MIMLTFFILKDIYVLFMNNDTFITSSFTETKIKFIIEIIIEIIY